MIRTLLQFTFIFSIFTLGAQTQGSAYTAVGKGVATTFVTDYHSLGINSSALGWGTGYEDKHVTLGMTEFSMGIYSDSLSSDKLNSLFKTFRNGAFGKQTESADWEQQAQNAADYLNSGVSIDATYNWFGFAYQNEKLGGIAFSIQERYNWYSKLSQDVSTISFGVNSSDYFDQYTVVYDEDTSVVQNYDGISEDTLSHAISGRLTTPFSLSDITKGTDIKFTWNRHYNFGYGRKLFGDSTFALYAGIGGRYITSAAMFDFESNDNGISLNSAVSPNYDIDYGEVSTTNPSNIIERGNLLPKAVGSGYGVDLSVSARLFNKLKVGLAVNNIGAVTYKRNVYSVKDSTINDLRMNGIDDNNITSVMDDLLKEDGILNLVGEEKVEIKNAATIRLGGSMEFGEKLTFGFDFIAPFDRTAPGSIQNPIFSLGGEVKPLKWLALSVGYLGGGIYKHNIPVGVNFVMKNGTYEFGISSRDALSFFLKGSNSISAAFGVLRVRF